MTRFTCSTYRCEATYETKCKHGCCEVWETRTAHWWVHKSEAFCPDCSSAWPSAASQVRNWRAAAVKEDNERVCSDCIQRNCGDLVCAVVPLVNGNGHGNNNHGNGGNGNVVNGHGNGGNGHGNVVNGGNGNVVNGVNGGDGNVGKGGKWRRHQMFPPKRPPTPPPPPVETMGTWIIETFSALTARIVELETWRDDHAEAVEHCLLQLQRWREVQLETFEERLLLLERWREEQMPPPQRPQMPPPQRPLGPPGLPRVAYADLAANDESVSSKQSEESFTWCNHQPR